MAESVSVVSVRNGWSGSFFCADGWSDLSCWSIKLWGQQTSAAFCRCLLFVLNSWAEELREKLLQSDWKRCSRRIPVFCKAVARIFTTPALVKDVKHILRVDLISFWMLCQVVCLVQLQEMTAPQKVSEWEQCNIQLCWGSVTVGLTTFKMLYILAIKTWTANAAICKAHFLCDQTLQYHQFVKNDRFQQRKLQLLNHTVPKNGNVSTVCYGHVTAPSFSPHVFSAGLCFGRRAPGGKTRRKNPWLTPAVEAM